MGEVNMIKGISIIIPAYQEADSLSNLLPLVNEVLKKINIPYEILCVDTMESMDNTENICQEKQATYVKRMGGNNYGDAIRTGFITAQYQYAVVMDADGSHDPKYIQDFYSKMNSGDVYDLIIGSRYIKGGNTQNPFILKAMSYILNFTYRIVLGIKVKDISDSFRMYKTEQVKALTLECDNFDIVEEILVKLVLSKKDFAVFEYPIYFEERKAGVSKRKLGKFILSYLKTMKNLKRIQNNYSRKGIMQ